MPDALRIGLLGPLHVRDGAGRSVPIGGRQLRVLLILLALDAGRVVPAGSLAEQLWPGEPPGNPGNALQTPVSRLRAGLRRAGLGEVIESHPAGYRLAVPPDAVDATVFGTMAARGRRALAEGNAQTAARVLRSALEAWRGQPLADAAGCDAAEAAAAALTELRSSALADQAEVPYAVLDAVGVREPVIRRRGSSGVQPGASPLDRLTAALADRDDVLVLDNCEHVIEAAAALAGRVLAACPPDEDHRHQQAAAAHRGRDPLPGPAVGRPPAHRTGLRVVRVLRFGPPAARPGGGRPAGLRA